MTFYNTRNPLGSTDPRDLYDNAQNYDSAVNSQSQITWYDRFGNARRTWHGMELMVSEAASKFGYITLQGVSFTTGATVNINEILLNPADGMYYKWTGNFPAGGKDVPPNSSPSSTGGVAAGAWVSVADQALRTELERGQYLTDGTSCYYVPGFVIDQTTDNRAAAYSFPGQIYIPADVIVRCNFLPEDDVRKFIGEGKILTRDPWGHEHNFDVGLAWEGPQFSVTQLINQTLINYPSQLRVGVVGDSITDGAWGKLTWTENPHGPAPLNNLNSTDYDHSAAANGGSHSWFAHMNYLLNMIVSRRGGTPQFLPCNAALSGMKLSDGWGYRNFDHGFFQNAAYGNTAPGICFLSMGWNDYAVTDFASYADQIDAFIRKAQGYGCVVVLVTVNRNDRHEATFESAVKDHVAANYRNVEYLDVGAYLERYSNRQSTNIADLYNKADGSYDITHPQPLGQSAMGSFAAYLLAKSHIPTLKAGQILMPYTDKYWDCVGKSSGTHYQATARPANGAPYLNKLTRLIGFAINKENVDMTTLVFVEDDESYLTVLEPYTHGFSAAGRDHRIRVESPGGITLAEPAFQMKRELAASTKLSSNGALQGDAKTLTTGVCKLRYGLNMIQLSYDGAPDNAYPPYLMLTNFNGMGAKFQDITLSFPGMPTVQRVYSGASLDPVSMPRMCNSPASLLPNTFGGAAQLAGSVKAKNVPGYAAIILFYDEIMGSGVVIQRRGDVWWMGDLVSGAIIEASMVNTAVTAVAGELSAAFYYTTDGKSNVTLFYNQTDSFGKEFTATGGVMGVYTVAAATMSLGYQTTFLDR